MCRVIPHMQIRIIITMAMGIETVMLMATPKCKM